MRTRTRLPGLDPSPAWSRAREITPMWSAAVFAPALPGRSMIAAHYPVPAGPWSNQAVSRWYPKPPLKVGAAPSLAQCASTTVASMSITRGEVALIPAVGALSPARSHHPPPHPPPGRLEGRLDRVGVLGQGLDQPADRRVGGDRAEDLLRAAQQGQVRQGASPQGRAQRQIQHGLARIVNRPRPPPGRQGPRQPDVQAHGPDDPGQQPRPGQAHRRNVPRLHAHSRVQPGTPHHEGAPPLGFSDIDNPHYPRTRSTLTPTPTTPDNEKPRLILARLRLNALVLSEYHRWRPVSGLCRVTRYYRADPG